MMKNILKYILIGIAVLSLIAFVKVANAMHNDDNDVQNNTQIFKFVKSNDEKMAKFLERLRMDVYSGNNYLFTVRFNPDDVHIRYNDAGLKNDYFSWNWVIVNSEDTNNIVGGKLIHDGKSDLALGVFHACDIDAKGCHLTLDVGTWGGHNKRLYIVNESCGSEITLIDERKERIGNYWIVIQEDTYDYLGVGYDFRKFN